MIVRTPTRTENWSVGVSAVRPVKCVKGCDGVSGSNSTTNGCGESLESSLLQLK